MEDRKLVENEQMRSYENIDNFSEMDRKILRTLGEHKEMTIGDLCGRIGSNDKTGNSIAEC